MEKNKILVIFNILLIVMIFSMAICNNVYAKIDTSLGDIDDKYKSEAVPVANSIIGTLKVIGAFSAVAMAMIVGIKYMISSTEQKAEYKKTAIAYLLGALLIFATPQLVDFIYNFFN